MPFKNPHPLYSVWQGMKRRCYNPNCKMYYRYGGRGITVCDEWKTDFSQFVKDMGDRPTKHTIERIDNNLGYFPTNCRWVTRQEQQLNLERTHRFMVEGEMILPCVVAKQTGQKMEVILKRIRRGESLERIKSAEKLVRYGFNTGGGKASGQKRKERTHCKNGHEFTPDNTLITKEGWRACRRCHADRELRRKR